MNVKNLVVVFLAIFVALGAAAPSLAGEYDKERKYLDRWHDDLERYNDTLNEYREKLQKERRRLSEQQYSAPPAGGYAPAQPQSYYYRDDYYGYVRVNDWYGLPLAGWAPILPGIYLPSFVAVANIGWAGGRNVVKNVTVVRNNIRNVNIDNRKIEQNIFNRIRTGDNSAVSVSNAQNAEQRGRQPRNNDNIQPNQPVPNSARQNKGRWQERLGGQAGQPQAVKPQTAPRQNNFGGRQQVARPQAMPQQPARQMQPQMRMAPAPRQQPRPAAPPSQRGGGQQHRRQH